MKILAELHQSKDVVHVMSEKRVKGLIQDGFLRRVTIQPAPRKGLVAVNLTMKGKREATKAMPESPAITTQDASDDDVS